MEPINSLSYLLQHTPTIMYRQSDQLLQERLGIGMSQFKLLMMLKFTPNIQQRTLAESLGQTEASISRQTKLLTERGMLDVAINPDNKREHITTLTAKGAKIADAANDILHEYHDQVFERLSEKQRQRLSELLTEVHEIVCQTGRPYACDGPLNFPGALQ